MRLQFVLHQGCHAHVGFGNAFGTVQQLVERCQSVGLLEQLLLADGLVKQARRRVDDARRIKPRKGGQRLVIHQTLRQSAGVKQPQDGSCKTHRTRPD